jgi:hypothetical protein
VTPAPIGQFAGALSATLLVELVAWPFARPYLMIVSNAHSYFLYESGVPSR